MKWFWLAVSFSPICFAHPARAEIAAGLAIGAPGKVGFRAIAHPKAHAFGGQFEYASTGTGTGQVTYLRLNARYANTNDPFRFFEFLGVSFLTAAQAQEFFGQVMNIEAGLGAEARWVPGVGLSFELGPQFAVASDPRVNAVSFIAELGFVFWLDTW